MMGLKGATSHYACVWCKIHKNNRWDTSFNLDHYQSPDLKRSLKEMFELARKKKQENKYCCDHEPLLHIELDKDNKQIPASFQPCLDACTTVDPNMSLRNMLKVPKYGLFSFASDKSMSIVPTKDIAKVVKGDKKTRGSVVVVKYEKEELEATIIGVAG